MMKMGSLIIDFLFMLLEQTAVNNVMRSFPCMSVVCVAMPCK